MSLLAFGFGTPMEYGIIAVVVLLLFGGTKLAGFGKSLGEGIKEFKKATQDEDDAGTHILPPTKDSVVVKSEDKHSV